MSSGSPDPSSDCAVIGQGRRKIEALSVVPIVRIPCGPAYPYSPGPVSSGESLYLLVVVGKFDYTFSYYVHPWM